MLDYASWGTGTPLPAVLGCRNHPEFSAWQQRDSSSLQTRGWQEASVDLLLQTWTARQCSQCRSHCWARRTATALSGGVPRDHFVLSRAVACLIIESAGQKMRLQDSAAAAQGHRSYSFNSAVDRVTSRVASSSEHGWSGASAAQQLHGATVERLSVVQGMTQWVTHAQRANCCAQAAAAHRASRSLRICKACSLTDELLSIVQLLFSRRG